MKHALHHHRPKAPTHRRGADHGHDLQRHLEQVEANRTHSDERKSWFVLALLAVAQFMVILDVTVVNVALPSIGDDLGFKFADLHWVISAYVLFTGGLMLLGGRLSDLVGRRQILLSGLAIFTLSSLLSGLAWSPSALVASRALQGVGAALLLPSCLSIVTTTYTGEQRAKALALWGALGAGGAAAGVLIGGVLTSLLSWHWIFFVNVPVGVVVAVLAIRRIPSQPSRFSIGQLDVAGAITLTGALSALVLAVQQSGINGWGATQTLVRVAIAVALLITFAAVEHVAARPLIPFSVLRLRSLTTSAAMMLVATGLLVGGFFVNTLYLQGTMNASPIETGLAFFPLTLMIVLGAHVASHLMPTAGTRPLMAIGFATSALGTYLLGRAGADASYVADILPGFLILGFGMGLAFVSISVSAMADVSHNVAGLASGLMSTAHELGAAIGVAVLAAVAVAAEPGNAATQTTGGHHDALIVASVIALAAAAVAAAVVPSIRPEAGTGHPMH